MPIPNNELFESFLSGTKLVKDKPEGTFAAFSVGGELLSEAPTLYLSYPEIELKLDSVVKRIASELKANGCVDDYEIALATLGVLVETRGTGTSSIARHAEKARRWFRRLASRAEQAAGISLGSSAIRG